MSNDPIELEGDAAWSRGRRIGHYGGALDKVDCRTEEVPYAFIAYNELRAMRSSAYSTETGNLVDAENVAIARSSAARFRAGEKLATNGTPLTSDERLEYWVEVLDVPFHPGDTRQEIRARCSAFYKLAEGATEPNVDLAIAELLGNNFVRTWRARGTDLANPPPQTFALFTDGEVQTAGLTAYTLGSGVWLSERAHLTVEVQLLEHQTLGEFLRMMNVDLFQLLDRMLPSDMTFNWALDVETGFALDVSQLDFTGFSYA